MKKQEKPPKKKSQDQGVDPSGKNRKTPAAPEAQERITEPADSRSKAETTPQADTPSREEVIESWSKPVTNQDEQNKITNAGEGDIPIANK